MAADLARLVEEATARDDVRVVVLTGTGGAFCTGADLSGADAHERFDVRALDAANRIVRAITNLDKPVVAAVNGVAAGVGCSAALAADLVVAAESASFLLAFTRIGLMPDGGATATVAASIGRARAMRMALLAEPLPAREAYDAGLVSHLVPDAELPAVVASARRPPRGRSPAGARRHQEGGQRGHAGPARGRPGARALGSGGAAPHRRRRRGHACLRRTSAAGVPRGVTRGLADAGFGTKPRTWAAGRRGLVPNPDPGDPDPVSRPGSAGLPRPASSPARRTGPGRSPRGPGPTR